MKKKKIYGWTLILFTLTWICASHVQADGGYFSRRAVAVSADQRAIVTRNGDQISMSFSTGYTGEGEDFGWIIPTPVPPTIEDVTEAGDEGEQTFQILDKYTAPTITVSEKSQGCFPSGTQVLTSGGPRAIETVEAGTEVYSCNLESGEWTLARVSKQGAYHYEGDMIFIEVGQITIQATGNHPFCVLRGDRLASRPISREVAKEDRRIAAQVRWVEARDLRLGDVLKSKNAGDLVITSLASRNEVTEVYHLEIERYHNYGIHRTGILVHNGGKGEKTAAAEESPTSLITVYGTVTLEHYEVSILGAADASALLDWLRENDYQVDPAAEEILDTYIEQNWAFVAVKLNPSEKRHYDNEFLPPLTVRFRHSGLIFPLRISSVSTTQTVKITLYVIAESTVTSSNLPATALRYDSSITKGLDPEKYIEACIRNTLGGEGSRGLVVMWGQRFIDRPGEVVRWGGGITTEEAEQLRATIDGLMKAPFSATQVGYLTRLETRMDPASMTDDIELILDSEPRSFRVSLHANKHYDSPVTSKETKLIAASQVGELERIKELLAAGADVDARDKDQRTALMMAVRSGHTQIIRILLGAGADVNVTPEYGETALMSAARLGDIEASDILLVAGAEVNAMPLRGETALMKAAAGGHSEIVRTLLVAGAQVNAFATNNGWTALMRAAGSPRYWRDGGGGHAGIVRMLLAAGADVNTKDSLGETALMWAADGGHTEVVRILLDAGADVNASTKPAKYYDNHDRTTALFSAARRGYLEIVETLIRSGADVNATASVGESALITAAGNGHSEVVRILVQAGADVNGSSGMCSYPWGSTSTRDDPLTALMWAASRGHEEVVKVLIEAGADVNAKTAGGRTALAMAKKGGHVTVISLLVQAGAKE